MEIISSGDGILPVRCHTQFLLLLSLRCAHAVMNNQLKLSSSKFDMYTPASLSFDGLHNMCLLCVWLSIAAATCLSRVQKTALALVQGLPKALADSCQRMLDELNVRVRSGSRVTSVKDGRPSGNQSVGKRIVVKDKSGGEVQEETDLVLWTAGAFAFLVQICSIMRWPSWAYSSALCRP